MWLCTTLGFFDITCAMTEGAKPEPDFQKLTIQARQKDHLLNLILHFTVAPHNLPLGPIQDTPHTDYPYRMVLPKGVVVTVVAALLANLDYGKFMTAANAAMGGPKGDDDYMDFLHNTWANAISLSPPGLRPHTRTYRFSSPKGNTKEAVAAPSLKVPTKHIKAVMKGIKHGNTKPKARRRK